MSILQWEDQMGVRSMGRSTHSSGTLSCHLHISQITNNYWFFLLLICICWAALCQGSRWILIILSIAVTVRGPDETPVRANKALVLIISKNLFHCKSLGLGYYPSLPQFFRSSVFWIFKQKKRQKIIFDGFLGKLFLRSFSLFFSADFSI